MAALLRCHPQCAVEHWLQPPALLTQRITPLATSLAVFEITMASIFTVICAVVLIPDHFLAPGTYIFLIPALNKLRHDSAI